MYAIMDALAAHSTMSKQALESEKVRCGLRDILLGPAQLYEALRERSEGLLWIFLIDTIRVAFRPGKRSGTISPHLESVYALLKLR